MTHQRRSRVMQGHRLPLSLLDPLRIELSDKSVARKFGKSREYHLFVPPVGHVYGEGWYLFMNFDNSFELQSPSLLHNLLLVCTQLYRDLQHTDSTVALAHLPQMFRMRLSATAACGFEMDQFGAAFFC